MSYPRNDITSELQTAASKSGSGYYQLQFDSVFHQVIEIEKGFELDGNGYVLQVYGSTVPVTVYGKTCTGPAGWFLDSAGNPLGYKNSHMHPTGHYFSPLQAVTTDSGIYIHDLQFDFNVKQATDCWDGAVFLPLSQVGRPQSPKFENITYLNYYGGPMNSPDPIHVGSPGCSVNGLTQLASDSYIPIDENIKGGQPGALVGGDSDINGNTGVSINNVNAIGFLEFDGTMQGLQVSNVVANRVLIGTKVNTADWGGSIWNNCAFTRYDDGPVLNFSPSPATESGQYTNWTFTNCSFVSEYGSPPIKNPQLFGGTWGSGNTPITIPQAQITSGYEPLIIGIIVAGVIIFMTVYLYKRYRF